GRRSRRRERAQRVLGSIECLVPMLPAREHEADTALPLIDDVADGALHGDTRRRKWGIDVSIPLSVRASVILWLAPSRTASPVLAGHGRLSGGPIGFGLVFAALMRARSAFSMFTPAISGRLLSAIDSARRLASFRSGHDRIGVVRGCVRRCRPALLS